MWEMTFGLAYTNKRPYTLWLGGIVAVRGGYPIGFSSHPLNVDSSGMSVRTPFVGRHLSGLGPCSIPKVLSLLSCALAIEPDNAAKFLL